MDVGGGFILTPEQEEAWKNDPLHPGEYDYYVAENLYDPETRELFDVPEWMVDGDPKNGPFDFSINVSHEGTGW